jgi:hypothetical protein
MGWATFWATFLQIHLVALVDFNLPLPIYESNQGTPIQSFDSF